MSEQIELRECPFPACGGKAGTVTDGEWYSVYCLDCGVQSPTFSQAKHAAEWWNRRAERPDSVSVEKLRELVARRNAAKTEAEYDDAVAELEALLPAPPKP